VAELHITLSDGKKVRHVLPDAPAVIGRDMTCDLPIDDPSASRRHARFIPTAQGYVVEDLGSKNGTLVNGAPCTARPLHQGDRVTLGAAVAVFRDGVEVTESSVVVSDTNLNQSYATRYVGREKQLVISQRRLQIIYELSERLTTLQNRNALLENAMDICFEMLQFERGAIGLRRRKGRVVDWPVVRNLRGAEGELTISRSLLSRALEHGERAIFTDRGDAPADPTVSMVQHGIRSAMCVPLLHGEETLGVIYGDRTSTSTQYTDEDIDFFAGIAGQVSIGLINARLMEDQEQMVRMNRDLDLARSIQTGLFPATLPDRDGLLIAALNEPGQRVSGDYYDVIERPDGRCWVLMADVTGEGIGAALLMANLQAAVQLTIEDSDDPGTLMTRWNKLIYRNTGPSKFITALLALIEPKRRRITFSNAGHCPPFLLREGAPPLIPDGEANFPLGIVDDAAYVSHHLDSGAQIATFFCYTDGVVEAMNEGTEQFGMDRLVELLTEKSGADPTNLLKHVRRSVATFVGAAHQSDDITMLAARIG
jgi:phosphoserine phosphatase RsbU/P